nr:PREDICTED: coiled-coil domain-containing protein 33 isoform X1 [Lepisosteus oculatus]
MQRSRLKIEEKELDFEFEVVNVQFNELGSYVLRLTVENPLLEDCGTGVQLRVNDGDVLYTSTGTTDVIEQASLDEIYTCLRYKFLFTLPKGFCKNDKNHDVRLKVEALRLTGLQPSNGTKSGEAFFAIYPRTNAPRSNLYARRDEELYQYSGIMALLRVHTDYLAMHCGRLAYAVSFHESRPLPEGRASASRMPSIQEEDKGGAPSPGPSTLQVPPLTLGPSQSPSPENTPPQPTEPALPQPPTPQSPIQHPSPAPVQQTDPESNMRLSPEPKPETSSDSLPPTPRSSLSSPRQHGASSKASLHFPSPEETPVPSPTPFPATHVTEAPLGSNEVTHDILTNDRHVSRPGREAFAIILHGATSLPPLSDGSVPQAFATVKSGADERQGRRSQGVTHSVKQPTHCPSWGERVLLELGEEEAANEEMVLSVADSRTKELLAYYRLPLRHLQPFHHYHMELVQAHGNVPAGVRLYATVVRQVSALPRLPRFSFTGFEVLLQGMERPLREPAGPLLAVARIVPDYASYKDTMLLRSPRAAGITVTSVSFPQPPPSCFDVPPLTAQGHPQVSQAGYPEEQPIWNHCFLFLGRNCATIFTGGAALVLEFYPITTVMNAVTWHIRSPLGFSALPLDQSLYKRLMGEKGQRGVRVEQLPLQGSTLRTTSDTDPCVGVILRLIGSERPDSVLSSTDPSVLPLLDSVLLNDTGAPLVPVAPHSSPPDQEEGSSPRAPTPQIDHPPRLQLTLQKNRHNLPSHDALAEILPEYKFLFKAPVPSRVGPSHSGQHNPHTPPGPAQTGQQGHPDTDLLNQTYRPDSSDRRPGVPGIEDNSHAADVTAHEAREVENYRTAMRKMAEDIIALRKKVGGLESDNSQLRSELSLHQDLGRTLLDDTDIDVMTKAEIADRLASLKFKLASETAEVTTLKDKIQQLQNELIRKNDSEKELLRLQRAHQQQQAVLQKYQARVAKMNSLEATVRQQEKVIEKMEKVLDSKLKEKKRDRGNTMTKQSEGAVDDNRRKEMESALAAENTRLRGELEKLRYQTGPLVIQQPAQTQDPFPDNEKLSLLTRLEKAQARIQVLESQVGLIVNECALL